MRNKEQRQIRRAVFAARFTFLAAVWPGYLAIALLKGSRNGEQLVREFGVVTVAAAVLSYVYRALVMGVCRMMRRRVR